MSQLPEPRRITRSDKKIIAGVLGGFAEYFDIDSLIVRIIYVALSLFTAGFPGLLLYLVLWLIIPKK
ncbi:PspC domain-containing protein [Gaoshiqia sp. Z1-71]|uniref:PspC domain-containing protein n=1 Tax=Gaoshiqia hydrogeniformans TaxID=3290090 RepID=UPI003BF8076B